MNMFLASHCSLLIHSEKRIENGKWNLLTLRRPSIVSFLPSLLSLLLSFLFIVGMVNNIPKAPMRHQKPTHKNGSKNPPSWYKNDPTAGPRKN